jgi:hypothetical protein
MFPTRHRQYHQSRGLAGTSTAFERTPPALPVRIAQGDSAFDIAPSSLYDGGMHRTTINLDEAVYRRVKELARRKGQSLARTIEALVRASLEAREPARPSPPPVHRNNGPRPGVDVADRDSLYDLMEDR